MKANQNNRISENDNVRQLDNIKLIMLNQVLFLFHEVKIIII